jgi:hypothetical protein
VNSLPAGMGSNDIGLDRGQFGGSLIVHFERSGPKVLLVAPNQDYRALMESEPERQAVRESFAQSVIWGFMAEAFEGDRVLVDATAFYLRTPTAFRKRSRARSRARFRSTRAALRSIWIARRTSRRIRKLNRHLRLRVVNRGRGFVR